VFWLSSVFYMEAKSGTFTKG